VSGDRRSAGAEGVIARAGIAGVHCPTCVGSVVPHRGPSGLSGVALLRLDPAPARLGDPRAARFSRWLDLSSKRTLFLRPQESNAMEDPGKAKLKFDDSHLTGRAAQKPRGEWEVAGGQRSCER
jgi:hypothetical protein